MARHKVLVIVPFPLTEKGMTNRRAQLAGQTLDPDIEFDFKPVKTSGALLDSNPDFLQLDVAITKPELTRNATDTVPSALIRFPTRE